jgi:hypothetical protein
MYDEEGDDERQEDEEEQTSGAQQVEFVETVSAVSGDEALGDDGTVLAGKRDMPSAAARNRYIVQTLDAMAQSDSESSTYFYSEGRTMGDTGPHAGSPSDPTHCDWAPKSEVPFGNYARRSRGRLRRVSIERRGSIGACGSRSGHQGVGFAEESSEFEVTGCSVLPHRGG